ncbi:MAG: Stk1 family PASTA domain-containing Ser/Thr kinase [Eubacteriaceae bacterium]|nr:Stk1 family PASTA domain-containing Ser/Thr kinase [Eubacteriaceae bacterium]
MKGELLSNRYEILEVIGQGGMAIVYKATDTLLNRTVAVKVLKKEFNENEQFIKKFRRESQAAASLSHNNIVNVFDVGVENNNHYIVMEYVKGDTLKEYIKKKGKLSWKETIYLAKQIAFALDHAHKNKIIHRDIKPHNIIISEEIIPKVTDFGIARAITSSTVTLVEETMGSVHYISPEQARGGFVDERSDLYSLGIVMFEMLTGRVPFDGDNSVAIAIRHIQEEIEFSEDDLDDVPEGLEDIVLKLIRKNPKDRYENARELIKDLLTVQSDSKAKIGDAKQPVKKQSIIPAILTGSKFKNEKKENKGDIKKNGDKVKKPSALIVAGLIVVFALIIFIAGNLLAADEVTVPDVKGLSLDEAVKLIEDSNLKFEIEKTESSTEVPDNHVISQSPSATTVIKEGQTVKLIMSGGPKDVTMPNVVGKFEDEGVRDLENLNFVVKEINRQFNDEYEAGIIYEQNPLPNTTLKEGAEIVLYVSKGKDTAVMKNLVGMTVEEAKSAILADGLQIGEIKEVASSKYEKGIVVSQSPEANLEVNKNSVVTLTVSKGKVKSKTVNIDLGSFTNYDPPKKVDVKVILIDQDNVSSIVYQKSHMSDEKLSVTLEGVGVMYYQVEIDGEKSDAVVITF